jgi:PAS domain S-box-containing protein
MNLKFDAAQEILKSSHDAIVVVNDDGCIVYANRQAEQLFAYDSGEMTGKTVEELMPDVFRKNHEKHRRNFSRSPRSRPLVSGLSLQGQRKDGRIFDAEIALTPVETKDGMLISSTIRDISADDTSEAYFKNILESAPDAMVIIDHHGKITIVNGQAERMFGYARQDMLGKEIEMLLPESLREHHISHRAAYAGDPHLRPMGVDMDLRGIFKVIL